MDKWNKRFTLFLIDIWIYNNNQNLMWNIWRLPIISHSEKIWPTNIFFPEIVKNIQISIQNKVKHLFPLTVNERK